MTKDEMLIDINTILERHAQFLKYAKINVKPQIIGTKSTYKNVHKAYTWLNRFVIVSLEARKYWYQQTSEYWNHVLQYHRCLPETKELHALIIDMKHKMVKIPTLLKAYKNVVSKQEREQGKISERKTGTSNTSIDGDVPTVK